MTISLNWLREYLDTDLTPEQIALILTDIGLEVDRFEKSETIRGGLEGVVVGHVLTCIKHADADKLSITTVDVGEPEPLQIVCGAPNVAAGQKVLVATVNTTLYPTGEENGFKIKKSKIRGVESLGMICAEDELGLGAGHDGIMVLDTDAVPGTKAIDALGIKEDYVIEIGLTPNRIDAASHFGVARDLAAYLKAHGEKSVLSLPSVEAFKQDDNVRQIHVTVENTVGAPRYSGITITGITIAPSPEWLQAKLRSIGLNPHNNVVDITNFVLHETGQPLHAFDADKVDGGAIIVKTCPEGTPFVTLDGVERTLSADDLMICNATKPMCIAGVFGGRDSGVSETTTSIFLESAYFNPAFVRKTARRHGLSTDSSFRYERGADPNMTIYALKRAALLIKELAGGKISSPITDIYPERIEPFRFELSFDRLNRLIGKEIPQETVRTIIAALDIAIETDKDGILGVAVPPFRVDVRREADLAEDILRIYGYNNIEMPERLRSALSYAPQPDVRRFTNMVSDMLTSNGFNEIMSNSLTRSSYYEGLESFHLKNCVKILNPLSSDLDAMRQTLLFNALEAVQLNANRRNADLKLYEFGNVYHYDEAAGQGLAPYKESLKLALTVMGLQREPSWNVKPQVTDFFFLRGILDKVLKRFGLDIYELKTETLRSDLFGEALSIAVNGRELVQIGKVSSKIRSQFDLKADVYFLELDCGLLLKAIKKHTVTVEDLSKYPEVRRDLALLLDKEVTFSELRRIAFGTEKKLLKSVSLFDVYEGDKLPAGKKSYALSFVLEDKTKTLTDKEIDKIMNNLAAQLEKECGATVRS